MQGFPDAARADADLLAAAVDAARAAAEVHGDGAGRGDAGSFDLKGRADFVTEVDREAERRCVAVLRERYPGHAVLAEEGTQRGEGDPEGPTGPPDAPVRWIVDPLDGTTNWMHGYPEHAVSVAAADDDGLKAGVVLNSATGELFRALRGHGARVDDRRLSVSEVDDLELALVGTGFPFKKPEALEAYLATLGRVILTTSGARRAGSAALDLCDVAAGRLDAFFEYWLQPWDVAAGALILREAGGVFERLPVPGLETGPAVDRGATELRAGGYLAANRSLIEGFRTLIRGA